MRSEYDKYILTDVNPDLINCYKCLQKNGAEFIIEAKKLFSKRYNTEKQYYALRDKFNDSRRKYERAIIFIYLNRFGYNGLCRYNRSGKFNVPFGRYKAPYFPEKELHLFYVKSQSAEFRIEDFRETFKKARIGQVFYCDPPYVPLSATAKFTDFSALGFSPQDQLDLAEAAEKVARKGTPVLVSNHDTKDTQELYKRAKLTTFEVRRSISCDGSTRGKVKELLAYFAPKKPREK